MPQTEMGPDGFANVYPHPLPDGMKQRVATGRVLVKDVHPALTDKPFGALEALAFFAAQELQYPLGARTLLWHLASLLPGRYLQEVT